MPVIEVGAVEPAMSVPIKREDGDGREARIAGPKPSSACDVNDHAFLFGAALRAALDAL
jgi:hypothetical protein